MSTSVTHDDATPPPAPLHQCINAACGCNDLVTAGACTIWCMEHTVEAADLQKGKATAGPCGCEDATCIANGRGAARGTAERGMA